MLFCLKILQSLNDRFAMTCFHCLLVSLWGGPTSPRAPAVRSRDKQRLSPQQRHLFTVEIPKNWHHARKRNSSDSAAAGKTLVTCRELILWGGSCSTDITWTVSRKQMLAHSSWSSYPAESLEMNRALGWKCPYLPAAQAHQLRFSLKQKSRFVVGELGRMTPPSLQKLISQTKHH